MAENVIEGWLDVASAARRLGVTTAAVSQLTARGTLAFIWQGGRKWIRVESVNVLLADPGYQARSRAKRDDQLFSLEDLPK